MAVSTAWPVAGRCEVDIPSPGAAAGGGVLQEERRVFRKPIIGSVIFQADCRGLARPRPHGR
jgi:hypothetical protein